MSRQLGPSTPLLNSDILVSSLETALSPPLLCHSRLFVLIMLKNLPQSLSEVKTPSLCLLSSLKAFSICPRWWGRYGSAQRIHHPQSLSENKGSSPRVWALLVAALGWAVHSSHSTAQCSLCFLSLSEPWIKCPREFSFLSVRGHFQYLKGAYKKEGEGLFTQADRDKGNSFKLRGEI